MLRKQSKGQEIFSKKSKSQTFLFFNRNTSLNKEEKNFNKGILKKKVAAQLSGCFRIKVQFSN